MSRIASTSTVILVEWSVCWLCKWHVHGYSCILYSTPTFTSKLVVVPRILWKSSSFVTAFMNPRSQSEAILSAVAVLANIFSGCTISMLSIGGNSFFLGPIYPISGRYSSFDSVFFILE